MPKRVLVVDNSPTIRKIAQLCLAEAGLEFEGAGGGKDALKCLKRSPPDLLLADVTMPEPNGYALCDRVKRGEFGEKIPVVLLADLFEPFDTDRAIAAGADGHIAKPFDAQTLLTMVGDQLGELVRDRAYQALKVPEGEALLLEDEAEADADASSAGGSRAQARSDGDLSPADLDALAKRIVKMLSADVVREIAWEVVPELSEILIRERMQQQNR